MLDMLVWASGYTWINLRSTHHASASEHSIVDRISRDVDIWTIERDFDNDKIVDMLQILTNLLLCMLGAAVVDDQISGGTNWNFVGNMTR